MAKQWAHVKIVALECGDVIAPRKPTPYDDECVLGGGCGKSCNWGRADKEGREWRWMVDVQGRLLF